MGQLDTRGFFPDNSPNQALFKIADTLQENARYKEQVGYRREKDAEADNWRKVNLIQDLTDLSKHQTSSDVANAVANQKAAAILQKYTADASKLSYADLQGGISKDMGDIIGGIDAMKTELEQQEEAVKILKQKYPSLDVNSLSQAQREDVLKRRLGTDGNFTNPLTIAPPSIDVTDPRTLSKYLLDTKGLDDTIVKAGGADPVEIASGDPYTNVVYGGKMPFWSTPNFKPEEVKGGFLKKGFVPSLSIKSEDLPSQGLPNLKNNPRKIVTSDVHEQFAAQHPLEVMAGTRKMFPTYDDMSEGERNLAERDYLYTKLKGLDKNNFQYKSSKSPAVTHNSTRTYVNTGNKGPAPIDLREYKDVTGGKDITDLMRGVKVTGLPNGSSLLAESVVYDPAKKLVTYKEYTDGKGSAPKTVSLTKFKQDIKTLNPALDMKFLDGLENPITGTKEIPQQASSSAYEIKGKKYTEAELLKMGYTKDQIAPYKKK